MRCGVRARASSVLAFKEKVRVAGLGRLEGPVKIPAIVIQRSVEVPGIGAKVGAGSIVVSAVEDYTSVVGIPARAVGRRKIQSFRGHDGAAHSRTGIHD